MSNVGQPKWSSIHLSPQWRSLCERNALRTFDDFWGLPETWIDEPNRAAGGWSAVSRHRLAGTAGEAVTIFVKRQHNYFRKHFLRLARPTPVIRREVKNTLWCVRAGIATVDIVAHGEQRRRGAHRAVLASVALDGYQPLEELVALWQHKGWLPRRPRRRLIAAIANFARDMHQRGMVHRMFYPKHIFVEQAWITAVERRDRVPCDRDAIRVIDLESAKRTPFRIYAAFKDLEKLRRHAPGWSRSDQLFFYKCYAQRNRLGVFDKFLIRRMLARAQRKASRKRRR